VHFLGPSPFRRDFGPVAIRANISRDFSSGDEILSSGDKLKGLEHKAVTEIVRVDGLAGFRELVRALGRDGDVLLRGAGIDPAALTERDGYRPSRNVFLAYELAQARLKCPDFGMRLAGSRDPDLLGPLAVAMRNAATGRDAFECAQRF